MPEFVRWPKWQLKPTRSTTERSSPAVSSDHVTSYRAVTPPFDLADLVTALRGADTVRDASDPVRYLYEVQCGDRVCSLEACKTDHGWIAFLTAPHRDTVAATLTSLGWDVLRVVIRPMRPQSPAS